MSVKVKFLILCFLLVLPLQRDVWAQDKPNLREIDRIRLAEAFRLNESLSDDLWKDWSKVPFAVLLVTPAHEFLIQHPKPSKDFASLGYDSLLKSEIYYRKRNFSTSFLATFPAVGGVSTAVVGQAENTDAKTSTPWIVTLLHEHFHQLQDAQPDFFADVEALNLSGGDQTGMWQINYAFPYETPEVAGQLEKMSRQLAEVLQTGKKAERKTKSAEYLNARRQLQAMLAAGDYNYFSFQLWKEGIARYTQFRAAKLASKKYKPSKAFRELKDFTPFKKVADDLLSLIIRELTTLTMKEYKRVAFYPIGAAEGLLLDEANPNWRDHYFAEKFYVEKYFDTNKTK